MDATRWEPTQPGERIAGHYIVERWGDTGGASGVAGIEADGGFRWEIANDIAQLIEQLGAEPGDNVEVIYEPGGGTPFRVVRF